MNTIGFEGRRKLLARNAALKAMQERFCWQSEADAIVSASSMFSGCPLAGKKPIKYRRLMNLQSTKPWQKGSPLRQDITQDIVDAVMKAEDSSYMLNMLNTEEEEEQDEDVVVEIYVLNQLRQESFDFSTHSGGSFSSYTLTDVFQNHNNNYSNNANTLVPPLPCTWEEIFREMGNCYGTLLDETKAALPSSDLELGFLQSSSSSSSSNKRLLMGVNNMPESPKRRKSLEESNVVPSDSDDSLSFLASAALMSSTTTTSPSATTATALF